MTGRIALATFSVLAVFGCTSAPIRELPPKHLPLTGERFWVDGHAAFLIPGAASHTGGPRRWVLYAPTLKPYPDRNEGWLLARLTEAGVAMAGIDVGESYGNAEGAAAFATLCDHLVERGYSRTPVLLARSRGGLQQLAFAARHPDRVAGIGAIYPVCDLTSYPGLERAARAFGTDRDGLAATLAEHNPIEHLAPIAAAEIPMFAIHGDHDSLVPLEANTAALAERYRALGGAIDVEVAAGQGHNAWTGFFQSQRLLTFLLEHAR